MRVVIIGGSGHVGTYLVPRLVEAGHEVLIIPRGQREPYQPHSVWKRVRQVLADRSVEEQAGIFGSRVRDLKPDVVIDMICFTEASARLKQTPMRGRVLEINSPAPDRAMSILKSAQYNQDLPLDEVVLYGAQIHAVIPNSESYRGAIRQTLEAASVTISSLEWIEPTLEDVFISAVNRI